MRRPYGCSVCEEAHQTWKPSQEQIDALAPEGDRGYYPGRLCVKRVPCYGITDYEELKNKPSINGVELIGDKSCHDIKVMCRMRPITNEMIDDMFSTYNLD